ncbi:pyruvate, phosphate dikinase [Pseudonocardia sulfidoxydans NBRC 16205]|uniref:Pyruvate, phosphate dikinase n=1 Tax=Pseudonocardia sulfidoxydans NBRC 16205 TaxID=1223511 RepID=A0A511DDR8_9PSEU|nr:pyruvate, phosphate dikinase [Pseudonocardia sulfidoxydans]GEL22936.1 pyruvate, phosphate dikinase [Pseudonocardia sulfidoxydans NBRC 16205]
MTAFTIAFDEADPADVDRLGGKGSGLARMTRQGLRVPPGYVIGTDACRAYLGASSLPDGLVDEVRGRLAALESTAGKTFGGGPVPLLLSVRSGAPISMPGMMDTILNLGLDRAAAVALAEATGDSRFVADVVARFHAMYAETVLDALDPGEGVDALVAAVDPGEDPGAVYDRIWAACEETLLGESVPADPREQLVGAIEAVFRSWNTRRARTYRDFHGIPHDLGTAVVVQSMVFGNLSDDSGSGVVFTRNPVTGEPGLFGEYLAHSQGEDVVAGTRTPDPVAEALAPDVLAELRATCDGLERAQGDVLDIEFTVERGTLYLLQVRSAKRTPEAAVRIAADLVAEGLAAPAAALRGVSAEQVRQVQRPGFADADVARARAEGRVLTTGIGACPGQVSGVLVLDPDRAGERAAAGEDVVLARTVTSPADLHGMIAAQGIVTATGGSTSHAAVVARALGTTCVVGAGALRVDETARTLHVDGRTLHEGDEVSLDGSTGELFAGRFAVSTPAAATGALGDLLAMASDGAGAEVLARVTLPSDVSDARDAGASGLVTAIDDVLVATGHLDGLVSHLLADDGATALDGVADLVATEFAPLLAAAGDVEIGVRAIDLVADEARELLQQTALTTRHPELTVPLGRPALVEAQLRGLERAAGAARVHLAVRHLTDAAEAAALRELGTGSPVGVGAYVTGPRAAFAAKEIAAAGDVLWVEVRTLQAAVFGIPARHLLTAEPLDGYVRRGLLSCDPRVALDPAVEDLLVRVAAAQDAGCRVGMRLSGRVSEQMVAQLYALGFRRFAVDVGEVRPVRLALGKAALQ